MIVLVCGSRDWSNKDIIRKELSEIKGLSKVIHGNCRGADLIAAEIANELGIEVQAFPANWKTEGRSAGPKRNQRMLEDGNPDFVLAFHDDIDESKGTKDMISKTIKKNIPYKVIREIFRAGKNEIP